MWVALRVRRRWIEQRTQPMFSDGAEVTATQEARIWWLNGGLGTIRGTTSKIAHDFSPSAAIGARVDVQQPRSSWWRDAGQAGSGNNQQFWT